MDSFLFSIEENLQRQMYISGYRITFLAEDYITRTGNYTNINLFFNQAFFNGTVSGVHNDIMNGATYSDLVSSINQKASKLNVNITLSNPRIIIAQSDPWHINFTLTSDFTMEDKSKLARWDKQQTISSYIPVENFEDPIYIINTNAKVSRKINKTIYEGIYVENGNVANLLSHVNHDYYTAHNDSPSFIKRLSGDFSADKNGIESFVDISQLFQQGVSVTTKSVVDYIYFSSNTPSYYSVAGMPSWFKIDDAHITKYNVTGLTS